MTERLPNRRATQPDFLRRDDLPPPTSDGMLGLSVRLPDLCLCGDDTATIEEGGAMHKAGLRCACGRHRGWVSHASFEFTAETIRLHGRPTQPIKIRTKARTAAAPGAAVAEIASAPTVTDMEVNDDRSSN